MPPGGQERVLALLRSTTIRTSLSQSFLLALVEYGLLPEHYAVGVGKTGAIEEVLASHKTKRAKLASGKVTKLRAVTRSKVKDTPNWPLAAAGVAMLTVVVLLVWRRQRTDGPQLTQRASSTNAGSRNERELALPVRARGGYDAHRAATLARATVRLPRAAREVASPWEESTRAVYDPGALATALYMTPVSQVLNVARSAPAKRKPSARDITGDSDDEC